jgi:hypothetical protein
MPGRSYGQVRLRIITVLNENIFNRRFTNLVAEILNLIGYFLITPARICFLEFDDKIDYFWGNRRSADFATIRRAIILFGDELVISSHHSVWRK